MTFAYTRDIPNPPNNPSSDVPNMKINTNSISDLINVDHQSFGVANGGTHKQINFKAKTAQGAQVDPASVVYTANGSASTRANLIFKNAAGTFPISCLRVVGVCTTTLVNGAVPLDNGFNVTSITCSGAGVTYSVLVPAGIITGNNVIVFLNISASPISIVQPAWTWNSGTNTLTINLQGSTGNKLSFSIYQV